MVLSKKPDLPSRFIFLITIGLVLVISFQVSSFEDGTFQIRLNKVILLLCYYAGWALLIPLINGSLVLLEDFGTGRIEKILKFAAYALFIVCIHLVLSNIVFYVTIELLFGNGIEKISEIKDIWMYLISNRMVTFLFIAGLLKAFDTYQKIHLKDLRITRIQSQLHEARLHMLKAQINPHFLFNTLHSISSLIGYDDDKARKVTLMLSELLRKNLEARNTIFHSLEEEIDYLNAYLEIQLERFHDRLEIEINVDNACKNLMVPGLIFQPLIENAFTHGIDHLTDKGIFTFNAGLMENGLQVQISNTISYVIQPRAQSTGMGIENVKNRLNELYESVASLTIDQTGDLYTVSVLIPNKQ